MWRKRKRPPNIQEPSNLRLRTVVKERTRWPVLVPPCASHIAPGPGCPPASSLNTQSNQDRKSTRLNSSHQLNSYAVLCLKKKNTRPPTKGAALRPRKDIRGHLHSR